MPKTFTFRLDNGREMDVQGPTLEDAAARALSAYPGAAIIGWTLEETPDETEQEDANDGDGE